MKTLPYDRETPAFLLITWLISWPMWFVSGVLNRGDEGVLDFRWLVAQMGVFGPSLAAVILCRASRGELGQTFRRVVVLFLLVLCLGILIALQKPNHGVDVGPLTAFLVVAIGAVVVAFYPTRIHPLPTSGDRVQPRPGHGRWTILAVVLFPGLFLLAWAIASLQSGSFSVASAQGGMPKFGRLILLSFSVNLLFGGSLGEEMGWRGFLLPRLLGKYRPLSASLILGVIWAIWHAPVDLTAGFLLHGPAAILARLIWTMPLSVLFTWFYVKSGGNLLVALLLHTSINIPGDLGFSNYELAMAVFFVTFTLAAIATCFSSAMRRGEPELGAV